MGQGVGVSWLVECEMKPYVNNGNAYDPFGQAIIPLTVEGPLMTWATTVLLNGFGRIPKLLGAIERLVHGQRLRTAPRVGYDVNEFGQHLLREGKLVAGLIQRLPQLARGGMPGMGNKFRRHEE